MRLPPAWILVLPLAVVLGSPGTPAMAQAPAKRVSGKSAQVVRVARTEIFLGNDPGDPGHLESLSRVLTSDDADWNRSRVFSTRFSDPHARRERHLRGHMVVTHPNGDQTFLEYEFRWKPVTATEQDFELTARFLRGTGKFLGISGRWRERGRTTLLGDSSEWDVEYSVP
jgi:hypothetical protein